MSKGFIPEKFGELCKPLPDNIRGIIAYDMEDVMAAM